MRRYECCDNCERVFEDMCNPLGAEQSHFHRKLCIWCDKHYDNKDDKNLKCNIPVTLSEYLLCKTRLDLNMPKLRVTSAVGTPGTMESISLVPDPCFPGLYDEEKCLVHIKWDTGNMSDQPVTELDNVLVQPDGDSCAAIAVKVVK